jgi:hypothetical protein
MPLVDNFDYLDKNQAPRNAKAENVHTRLVGGLTDPGWIVTPPGGPPSEPHDELEYWGTNDQPYVTKIHSDSGFLGFGDHTAHFESYNPGGGGNNPTFGYVAPDRTKWNVSKIILRALNGGRDGDYQVLFQADRA